MSPLQAGASSPRARVLAFTRSWALEREQPETLAAIHDRLRSLGAELSVLCDTGVWSFRGDADEVEHTDRLAGDIVIAARLYGARDRGEAVFVFDGATVVRVAHSTSNLVEALDAAAELLCMRRVMYVANTNVFEPWRRDGAELVALWSRP